MNVYVSFLAFISAVSAAPSGTPHFGIIGGRPATLGEFPYIVSLQRPGDFTERPLFHSCAGVIISPTTVLTAASCISATNQYKVIAGVAGLLNLTNPDHAQELEIDSLILHPDYDLVRDQMGLVSLNDIGLVKFNGNFTYNQYVQPLGLPAEGSELADGSDVQFSGWGWHKENGWWYSTNPLQTINLTALNYQECYDAINVFVENMNEIMLDQDSTQCVGPLTDGQYNMTTGGDGGGPLVQNNAVVGISTWMINFDATGVVPKGSMGPAGVFTNVNYFLSWIKENVNDL